jgi:hypothetical protein
MNNPYAQLDAVLVELSDAALNGGVGPDHHDDEEKVMMWSFYSLIKPSANGCVCQHVAFVDFIRQYQEYDPLTEVLVVQSMNGEEWRYFTMQRPGAGQLRKGKAPK